VTIVAVHTGLFPDGDALDAALAELQRSQPVVRIDLAREDLGDEGWDGALAAILAADLVFTC
jgi:hypothetical protein